MTSASRLLLAALLLVALPGAAQPATDGGAPDPAELAREIAELRRRVEILGQELESSRTGSAPVVTATAAEAGQVAGLGPAASKVYGRDGLSVGGYGETIFSFYADHLQDGTRQPKDALGDTLRAVLYVGYKFNDWVVLNTELEFEHSGVSDEHAEGEAIVEFAYLDFLIRPWLNVRAGQVLLPVGFLNELHEPPVFLGALRPRLEGETGLIPTTWHELGVGLHGDLPFNLAYRVFILNGLDASRFNADGTGAIGGGRQDGHQVIANKPAVTGRLDWHPLPGALLGGSFYAGDSAQSAGLAPIWTVLLEAHAEYRASGFQARALYAHLTNSPAGLQALGASAQPFDPAGATGALQSGVYIEAGYDVLSLLPAVRQALVPFARLEWMNTQQAVAPGATADPANQQTTIALGLNYRPLPQVAVKADYDLELNAAGTGRNQLNLALGYLF
jgi:hypothetical protein